MAAATTQLPLSISIAPFPEGFHGDMDETFQQACLLMEAYIEGSFLTGLVLPPGSTLPTNDQGPIAMGGVWYFWDPGSQSYQPQTVPVKMAKNYAKNPSYQVQQTIGPFTLGVGVTNTFDMTVARATQANLVQVKPVAGPPSTPDNDTIWQAVQSTVLTAYATLAAGDIFGHEHIFEGIDILPLQGQTLSLGLSVYASASGTYSVYLINSGGDQSYVQNFTVPTPNVWQRVKIQGIPAFPTTGTWQWGEGQTGLRVGVALAVGTQWQTTKPGTWQPAQAFGTSSNINMLAVGAQFISIPGIKLEVGAACTPITVNSFAADYQDCIRYYWSGFVYQTLNSVGAALNATAYIANTALFEFAFPIRLCRTPTITPYAWQGFTSGQITNISTGTNYAVTGFGGSQKGVNCNPTGLTAAKGDVLTCIIVADARLK